MVAALPLLAACNKKDPEPELPAAEITLTKTEVEVDYKADSQALLKVTSSLAWKAEASDIWIKLSPASGAADKAVTLHVKAALNQEQAPRTGTVTITSGSSTATIKVTQKAAPEILTPDKVQDYNKIYIPKEYRGHGFLDASQEWYFGRSVQSEHFILFWSKDYGDATPDANGKLGKVNLNTVLDFMEQCFETYTKTLGFAEVGVGKSYLDQYKMMIFLNNSSTWKAEGWGYDSTIGAFWVNPDAAAGYFTIAHEIGHSFQYQVYCDQLFQGMPDNGLRAWQPAMQTGNGCGFWEQTSQWQASIMRPEETFTEWQFTDKTNGFAVNAHRHILHEQMRYASYMIHRAWTDRYGMDAVGRVWRSAKNPDDALQAYQHLFGLSLDELNAQLYDYAARCVTWDFSDTRDEGVKHLNTITWSSSTDEEGWRTVSAGRAPEATGFNHIRLKNYSEGGTITLQFEGLPEQSAGKAENAGWTVGFVAIGKDNSRSYGEPVLINKANDYAATLEWTVPSGARYVWAVVSATPKVYMGHIWDDNNSNDVHWPYRIKVEGANP